MVLREQRLHRTSLTGLRLALLLALLVPSLANGQSSVYAQTTVDAPRTITAISRDFDPVIVKNVLVGTPASEIYVYRFVGSTWEPVPYQIDMVTAGEYQATAVTALDADDEIVFLANDLGELPTEPISTSLDINGQWIEVEVTDPLSPGDTGYAYIVRSDAGLTRSSEDYVSFNAATRRATSDNYSIGWAEEHSGLEHLSLFGSGNVLDRTKTRLTYRIANQPPQTITEEGSAQLPDPEIELIKDGPVRVIVGRNSEFTSDLVSISVSVFTICYPSFLRNVLKGDLDVPTLTVENVRTSTDLANNVTGTYYNENTPAGVPIDGTPDVVAETPFINAWRQVALASGAMIQVTDLSGAGGFPRHYYKDDSTIDPEDTGDGQSYGDSGFAVVNPSGTSFTLDSNLYFLGGEQVNRGSEFVELYQNPVGITTELQGEPEETGAKNFMPFAKK